jgi:hypothetical protein
MVQPDLPSRRFEPRIYGVGAWTSHLHFAYDLVATLKPRLLVELGVDRGESYFAFCQSALENKTGTRCFGIDTWRGDKHAGGYDETTVAQVSAHNRENYAAFSTLIRSTFDDALAKFEPGSIDVFHLDGLHTESAVRHDIDSWLPKVRPGGIALLHDVGVRAKGFGVWRVWEELQREGRSWTFADGPGLGVWQKPPVAPLLGFLDQLLGPPNPPSPGTGSAVASESNALLSRYYTERGSEMQAKIAQQWQDGSIRETPFAQQTVIQIFHSTDGTHSEENSVYARIGHEGWKDLRIELPAGAGAAPLRIDFVSALSTIEIASIRLTRGGAVYFTADENTGFETIRVGGDGERMAGQALRIRVTGIDPQLYLPAIATPGDQPLFVNLRLRVMPAL